MMRQIYFPQANDARFGQAASSDGGGGNGGGGGANPAAAMTQALTGAAYAAGNLIDQGMTSEYKPSRRMLRIQNNLPKFIGHMKTLKSVAAHAQSKGRSDLATKVLNNRQLLKPAPGLGFPVPAYIKTGDTASMTVANDMLAQKVNNRQPGPKRLPIGFDGGNLRMVRTASQSLFLESLLFAVLPQKYTLQDADLQQAQNRALGAVNAVLLDPVGLKLLYPGDAEAAQGRIPKTIRDQILNRYVEWASAGLIPSSLPLPSWIFSFKADGSDAPAVSPSIGAYVVATNAVGRGQLTDESLRRLYGVGAGEVTST